MAAKTIAEVRNKLSDKDTGTAFSTKFAAVYFSQAFGSLPKSEVDLLIFTLLLDLNVITADGSIFAIAQALNITPTKARSLLFNYQLRNIDATNSDLMVATTLSKAHFTVDDKRLSFGIESPLIRAIIDNKLKERGIFADISLSGEILRVPLDLFPQFIELLLGEDRAKELEKELKEKGHLKDSPLNEAVKKLGEAAAKGAAGAVGKAAIAKVDLGKLFEAVRSYLSGGGSNGFGDVLDGLP